MPTAGRGWMGVGRPIHLTRALDREEEALVRALVGERLLALAAEQSREERLSGSDGERRAFDRLEARLRQDGVSTRRLWHDGYVSHPVSARLQVSGLGEVACITHAMAPSTSELTAELVDGSAVADVAGRVALVDGLATPAAVLAGQARGAMALVFVNDERLHEMIVSPVWGNPTVADLARVPRIPVLSVRAADGERIREALREARRLTVALATEVNTRWRTLPLLEAELPGEEPMFVLFSGHVDAWHLGAMDNAGAAAVMVEVARRLSAVERRRGLRVAFWSGHSHGRYAGSAWYADRFFSELRRGLVAHVNIDSVGGRTATDLTRALAMPCTWALGAAAIRRETGQVLVGTPPMRAGDQSFIGMGVPALFMELSEEPGEGALGGGAVTAGGGLGFWWHTPEDTLDKLDGAHLARDARVYLRALFRLVREPVLPFDVGAEASTLRRRLEALAGLPGAEDDLGLAELTALAAEVERRARRLAGAAEAVRRALDRGHVDAERVARVNEAMLRLMRRLIPVAYTAAGPFDHDPALPQPYLPLLADVEALAAEADADRRRALAVGLRRARNKVGCALEEALAGLPEAPP